MRSGLCVLSNCHSQSHWSLSICEGITVVSMQYKTVYILNYTIQMHVYDL